MKKSTLLHLRIPFSIFLLPVFLFAVAVVEAPVGAELLLTFVILHLFIYPASNGFNSYFDRDEGSIGGLKQPPQVSLELYLVSLLFDAVGTCLALFISWQFALMIVIYGLVSKAYSHPAVRLKKYPIVGWLAAGVFQGYFTFLMTVLAITGTTFWGLFAVAYQFPAVLSSLLLFGSYPMTQVYQHDEDRKRGDKTLSLRLGVVGTFIFTGGFFTLSVLAFWYYFINVSPIGLHGALLFQLLLVPILIFFLAWFLQVRKDTTQADFQRTMKLNWLSSMAFNVFFIAWWLFL